MIWKYDGTRLVHGNLPTSYLKADKQSLCVAEDNACNSLVATAFTNVKDSNYRRPSWYQIHLIEHKDELLVWLFFMQIFLDVF